MIYYVTGLVIAIAGIGFAFRFPAVKGYFGELMMRIWLKFLDKEKYRVIHDVMISSEGGRTAQIDHIIVSLYGIFVIETKNYRGWIFGDENGRKWTQVIYRHKNQFYNPILQNQVHVKALKGILSDYPQVRYIPIVAFGMRAVLKKLNVTSHVIYSPYVSRTVKRYTEPNISMDQLEPIVSTILSANHTDRKERKRHGSNIQDIIAGQEKAERGECPLCGGLLKKKNGRYGSFTGCGNYPRCKFVLEKGSKGRV